MNAQNNKKGLNAFVILLFCLMMFPVSCKTDKRYPERVGSDAFPLLEMEITELLDAYTSGHFTVEEVVRLYLDRIEAIDRNGPGLNAVIFLNPDALSIARELDRDLREGRLKGPLHGVPVLLKDNIDTGDKMPNTAGSRALMNSYPDQDSFVARKLREAGAVILGKTNLSEWANFRGQLSSSGWSGVGGQTKNPYILDRNPCGSSSGSAVAVSANLAMVAIGTETNGSIVCPSHANGIVGLKPTVGLVSRSGIIPIAFALDIAGPMTRTVRDAALVLGSITGIDPDDRHTLNSEGRFHTDYIQFLNEDGLKGKRIGLFTGPLGVNFKVDALMAETVEFMKQQGAEIIELAQISAPGTASHAYQVMLYEYKDGLNRYFAGLGDDAPIHSLEELIAFNKSDEISLKHFNQYYLKMAQEKGSLDSHDYREALAAMHKGSRDQGIDRVMDEHRLDAIIAPTGSPAWKTDLINGDAFQLGSSSPAAHAGYPNITVPMGFVEGLPVGLSIFGRAWSEPVLLEIAYAYERGTMHRRVPGFQKH
ncbi:MAG: amidase [Bacteroidales bacterium]|nr:amidase [Bacteroidales bacterium]